jgi:DNA polymerase IV
MPGSRARRLCPHLIFVPHRFEVYRAVSAQIREIFLSWTPLVQPLSLDEAYLDVTQNTKGEASATRIAEAIRAEIKAVTGLTASAGVSYNKFLAKIASDINKPDGLCVITPQQGPDFAAQLPLRKFYGVGPATAAKMEKLRLVTGADVCAKDRRWLDAHFGKAGGYFYWASRGVDNRAVNPNQERKSIGSETTFNADLLTYEACMDALRPLIERVANYAVKRETIGRTITLKLRYADFKTITRSRTVPVATNTMEQITSVIETLLQNVMPLRLGARLLGVTLSALEEVEDGEQDAPSLLL